MVRCNVSLFSCIPTIGCAHHYSLKLVPPIGDDVQVAQKPLC